MMIFWLYNHSSPTTHAVTAGGEKQGKNDDEKRNPSHLQVKNPGFALQYLVSEAICGLRTK
jgi:hypothetical protein